MARARSRRREPEVVEDEDDDEALDERDFVMARLAAAQVSLKASLEACDEALAAFVNPEDDAKGKERKELVASALEAAGCATRALESAEVMLDDGEVDFEAGEPWDEDDDEEEDDD